ncbi:hypothetical protein M9Y10_032115 [Tritrichomonas musculus]|uniref:Uncharacterized protein n=1 Tax=Tritrichomonas musculus TaxID=1915356 RepID=A0ABR2H062_9EUKA
MKNTKLLFGKSDNNSEIFDTIKFASRDIKQITIPKQIKYIKPHSFEKYKQLQMIEFSEDSNLLFIGKDAFSYSSIKKFTVPKSVIQIEQYAFDKKIIK